MKRVVLVSISSMPRWAAATGPYRSWCGLLLWLLFALLKLLRYHVTGCLSIPAFEAFDGIHEAEVISDELIKMEMKINSDIIQNKHGQINSMQTQCAEKPGRREIRETPETRARRARRVRESDRERKREGKRDQI